MAKYSIDGNHEATDDKTVADGGYENREMALKKANEAAHHLINDNDHNGAAVVLKAALDNYFETLGNK